MLEVLEDNAKRKLLLSNFCVLTTSVSLASHVRMAANQLREGGGIQLFAHQDYVYACKLIKWCLKALPTNLCGAFERKSLIL